jgi:hypothetical protein
LLATFLVTNPGEFGPGTLADAIFQANASLGADIVQFNIPGPGPHNIVMTTAALPPVLDQLTIDGTTQPGYSGTPIIQLDNAGPALIGLEITASASQVKGLSITGFPTGIKITGSNVIVSSNYIGMLPNGVTAVPNQVGIESVGANFTTVGGVTAAAGNVIAFGQLTAGVGVRINGGVSVRVVGNRIGTTASGLLANGSIGTGVSVDGNAAAEIGLLGNPASGNVIAGINGNGILLGFGGVAVSRNRIGINTANAPLGNTGDGIRAIDGGHVVDDGNTIAHNGGNGITITGPLTRVSVVGNSIYSNGGLGIDLNDDGVTPNDPGDLDLGPNGQQNYGHDLDLRRLPGGQVRFRGNLDSLPSTSYYVDFYLSPTRDPSGFGEGRTFIGTEIVTTNAGGAASWNFTSTGIYPANQWVSVLVEAFATTGTSEFSKAAKIYIPGDINGDGVINNQDIAGFVLALTNPTQFAIDYPDTPPLAADIDDNGVVNNQDIAPFVTLLTNPSPITTPRPDRPVAARTLPRPFAQTPLRETLDSVETIVRTRSAARAATLVL